MVDAIDFNTLDLTAEFAQEEELSQLEQSQHTEPVSKSLI